MHPRGSTRLWPGTAPVGAWKICCLQSPALHMYAKLINHWWEPGLCSTQIFRADSTLTHVTIQVTQL